MLSAFAFLCAVHSVSLQASALSFATHNFLKLLTAHENRQIIYWEVMVPFKECKGHEKLCHMWSLISDESASECDAGQPRRHLLTTGWSAFVNKKKLVSGDAVLFLR